MCVWRRGEDRGKRNRKRMSGEGRVQSVWGCREGNVTRIKLLNCY